MNLPQFVILTSKKVESQKQEKSNFPKQKENQIT